jgi:polyisoprenoid-binding protein YceI
MLRAWLFLCTFLLPLLVHAQTFSVDKSKSSMKIAVSSTLHDFTVTAPIKSGSLELPSFPSDLVTGAKGKVVVDAKSMKSGNKGRDKDMHEEVLETSKFPEVAIEITSISQSKAANTYQIKANLTLHGVTKAVSFSCYALAVKAEGKVGFLTISGNTKIDMTQWGVKPPNIIVNKVAKEVEISWSLTAYQS